jgi:hypothetical protein
VTTRWRPWISVMIHISGDSVSNLQVSRQKKKLVKIAENIRLTRGYAQE